MEDSVSPCCLVLPAALSSLQRCSQCEFENALKTGSHQTNAGGRVGLPPSTRQLLKAFGRVGSPVTGTIGFRSAPEALTCLCPQYAYFRMGVKHADVVRTDFLQYSITKTRQRHTFLERLGRYQTPDKKGQTQVPNPPVRDILRVSEAEFLARTACSSAEEFEVFKKLLAREEEEESESHVPSDKSTSEDEEDEDGEEEGEL